MYTRKRGRGGGGGGRKDDLEEYPLLSGHPSGPKTTTMEVAITHTVKNDLSIRPNKMAASV